MQLSGLLQRSVYKVPRHRPVTVNMSSAAMVNSSVSIADNSISMVINPQCVEDELIIASGDNDSSDSESDDSVSSSD